MIAFRGIRGLGAINTGKDTDPILLPGVSNEIGTSGGTGTYYPGTVYSPPIVGTFSTPTTATQTTTYTPILTTNPPPTSGGTVGPIPVVQGTIVFPPSMPAAVPPPPPPPPAVTPPAPIVPPPPPVATNPTNPTQPAPAGTQVVTEGYYQPPFWTKATFWKPALLIGGALAIGGYALARRRR